MCEWYYECNKANAELQAKVNELQETVDCLSADGPTAEHRTQDCKVCQHTLWQATHDAAVTELQRRRAIGDSGGGSTLQQPATKAHGKPHSRVAPSNMAEQSTVTTTITINGYEVPRLDERPGLKCCVATCTINLNLDDCWLSKDRGANGNLQVDPRAFPDGLEPVIAHVHGKGLKFGLYLSCGNNTCQGRAGSWGHEEQDAQYIAKLGVDYLKYDNCGVSEQATWANPTSPIGVQTRYARMGVALNKTARPI